MSDNGTPSDDLTVDDRTMEDAGDVDMNDSADVAVADAGDDQTPVAGEERVRAFPSLQLFSTIVIVGGAMLFLFATLHPSLIFRDNTPTGDDMDAHV